MNVITLDNAGLEKACEILSSKIAQTSELIALIGIRTGGARVASLVYEDLCGRGCKIQYFEAGASRPVTSTKKTSTIRLLLRSAPLFLRDWLRVIEHHFVGIRMKLFHSARRSVTLGDGLAEFLAGLESGRVFVIDDAIDSGATMKVMLKKLLAINPSLEYRIAVLVVTHSTASVIPDICVYRNVLLRFPWSSDYGQ